MVTAWWRRPLPLAAGCYPFVAMFPVLALTGAPLLPAIVLWGVLWLLLGLALQAEAHTTEVARPSTAASAYA